MLACILIRVSQRKKFRRRAAVEPVIGHLKSDFRMGQNDLHGEKSSKINALLAATGWNLKKMMEKLEKQVKKLLFQIGAYDGLEQKISLKLNF